MKCEDELKTKSEELKKSFNHNNSIIIEAKEQKMVSKVLKQKLGLSLLTYSTKYCNKLCLLSYFAGLAYFLALAYKGLNDGTYFSENALLPGLVQGWSMPTDFSIFLSLCLSYLSL